ncbi:protein adenylyltransferase SelO [Rhizobium oryzicola]|uniref:Protein nucleotidyltransferase YdiU n=1 Tax=Rhizobium oryzicola TaxID=1232668 RepID=A0ABT8ST00_9HYPH|nr:YdiU family protein [Rhizobium oryzicola]MDO1581534.1 YdiU family protein [Rhizobium oryzicola]
MFSFNNSYARLPDRFHASVFPEPVEAPALIKFNTALAKKLRLSIDDPDSGHLTAMLSGNVLPAGAEPLAMAYAGHQFGNFVPQLGDGRAILLGEVVDEDGIRRDIQLKGAGPTPFSRRGDGRAALGPVLREYIVSEAFAALGIPATRALAAVATGEPVYRETPLPGAVFVRVAASHVRIGTFQFFAARGDTEALKTLADYVVDRHYPDLKGTEKPTLALLQRVSDRQAELIARWLGVGFIHGVMNTDNMTISGETIDFGPCAFLDEYDPMKVFSSIDQQGRYAYRNQPGIGQWNIARLAECLLPLIDENEEKAVELANGVLKTFGEHFQAAWLALFVKKIGLSTEDPGDADLVQGLLSAMREGNADFTLTFRRLSALAEALRSGTETLHAEAALLEGFAPWQKAEAWLPQWRERLAREPAGADSAALMRSVNPAIIPRNHRIEEVIAAAVEGDLQPFERLLAALEKPYEDRPEFAAYTEAPTSDQRVLQTFCGT